MSTRNFRGTRLTLAQLSDLGELLGGIAVFASLVYLAIQIRQNTRSVRGSTHQQNTELWTRLFLHLAEGEAAQAYAYGMSGEPDIRPLHYTQFFFICRAMFVGFENQYYQMRQGVLDPETYAAYERSISTQFLAFRGFRLWWAQSRQVFTPAFIAHIDEMIAGVPELEADAFLVDWQAKATRTRAEADAAR